MGREEVGTRTCTVSAQVCRLCFLSALLSILLVFLLSPIKDAYYTGLAAHTISTLVIFIFSIVYGNSSFYDPAWYLLPTGVGAGWLVCNGVSIRGAVAFLLLLLWCCRFLFQWPWGGWFTGMSHEDWRFVDF